MIKENTKREIIHEDEDMTTIWRYDSSVTTFGPVSVEFRYKKGYEFPNPNKKKTLGDLVSETRKTTRKLKTP